MATDNRSEAAPPSPRTPSPGAAGAAIGGDAGGGPSARVWSGRLGRRLLGLVVTFALLILALVLANQILADRLGAAIDAQQRSVAAIARVDALAQALQERETLDLRAVGQLLVGDTVALIATRQALDGNAARLAQALDAVRPVDSALVERVRRDLAPVTDLPADIVEAMMDGDEAEARRLSDRHADTFTGLQAAIADRADGFAAASATAAIRASDARRLNTVATGLLGTVALLLVGIGVAYAWRGVLVPLTVIGDGLNRLAGHAADGPDRDEVRSLAAAFDRLAFLERDRARRLGDLDLRDRAIAASLDGMAIMTAEPGLPIRYANPALAAIFGVDQASLPDRSAIDLFVPVETVWTDRQAAPSTSPVAGIEAAVAKGDPLRVRGQARRGRQGDFWFDLTLAPVVTAQDMAPSHYVAIVRDITDQVSGETALRTATREAEAANHLKSLFLGNISHEVRTPLNAILGFSDILRTEAIAPTDPRYDDYLNEVQTAGQTLLTTISRIIDIARLESGETDPKMEPIRLARLLDEAIESLAQPLTQARVTAEIAGPVDSLTVLGDRRLLHTALLQVLGNAIRFSPPGGVVAIACAGADDGITVTIRDDGEGMTEEQAAIALSLFGQVRHTVDYAGHSGLGLGLPIAVRILEVHGGHLSLTSGPDGGTVARIALQRVPAVALSGSA